MSETIRIFRNSYMDSVLQLAATRTMTQSPGVAWAAAAMATEANVDILANMGFDRSRLDGAKANDLILAVRADSDDAVAEALAAAHLALFSSPSRRQGPAEGRSARSIEEAAGNQEGTNLAIVSVPGQYAAVEAHKALSAGLHVLLFSDNVPLADEIELKERAAELGLLLMGPGAGTAMLGGTGLGFANVVRPGRIGVAAAAGTGAQEAMTLLDRWGAGVSHVIGLGGRDLSAPVQGRAAAMAVEALLRDPGTDAVLLVSKPPAAEVAARIAGLASGKPLVAALLGLREPLDVGPGVEVATTLERGVAAAMASIGLSRPDLVSGLDTQVDQVCRRLRPERTVVRGLFSGGTLCYESLVILSQRLGPIYSNTPIDGRWGLPAPLESHQCLDLGEEEYTRGRPHPMIDPEARVELIEQAGTDPQVAAILLDVVLGFGAHPDPAGLLAPACEEAIAGGAGPGVVAYVLGTDHDPQDAAEQRRVLQRAGCIVPATAARAALAAAALATRRPALVRDPL
jgi:FdrA protein